MTGGAIKTIVVVDDDPAVLLAYGRLLGRERYRVRLVGDIDAIRRDARALSRADLLILDQRMPGITGLDLLRGLRRSQEDGTAGPRVLLISAYLDEDLRRSAARLGVAEVIEKPVDPARLLKSVRQALLAGAEGSAA